LQYRGTITVTKDSISVNSEKRRPSIFDALVQNPEGSTSSAEPTQKEQRKARQEEDDDDDDDDDDSYDESEDSDDCPDLHGSAFDEFFDIEDILRMEKEEKMKKKSLSAVKEEQRRSILSKMSKQLEPSLIQDVAIPAAQATLIVKDTRPEFSPGGTNRKRGRFRTKIQKNTQPTPPLSPFSSDISLRLSQTSLQTSDAFASETKLSPRAVPEATSSPSQHSPLIHGVSALDLAHVEERPLEHDAADAEEDHEDDLSEALEDISAADIVVEILNGNTDKMQRYMSFFNMTRCLELETQFKNVEKQLEEINFGVFDDLVSSEDSD